ncbi:kynureninase [Neobacillus soli]|uniref:kynureninase n=1 Tax=Neobacillus soli TaxID=220688 RepID=UPI000825130E|nr:kynureninase [Neobacillus soli]
MEAYTFNTSESYAESLDEKAELTMFRDEFYLQNDHYYMDGNSLGLLSKRAEQTLLNSLEDWKRHGIDGWMTGKQPWFYLSEKIGAKLAPLVGAKEVEVIATGSITANIHQLIATFYHPDGKRKKILADELTFPSDIYALQSQISLKNLDPVEDLIRVKSRDGRTINEEDIIAAMTDEVALILMPSVLYRSGQMLDMERLTKEAHQRGILIGFDLAHSAGAIPHELHNWEVDFAMWCNYKYLNGGPGSVGGLFVHEKHFGTLPGLTGWFSSKKEKQFDMEHVLTPAETAGAFQIGTPHVLSAAPILGSLEIFHEAGMENIRRKSLSLTRYMMDLIDHELQGMGFAITNPSDDRFRGGHVCLEHDEAARICKALKEKHVTPDFRAPNVIRLAPIALYTSYHDIWKMVQILKTIMKEEQYKKFKNEREVVA